MALSNYEVEYEQLRRENQQLRRKNGELDQKIEEVVDEYDLVFMTIRNKHMSFAYRFMYLSLVESAPGLLNGLSMQINVYKIRVNAGWVSQASATNFFADMQTIGALKYDPGTYNRDEPNEEERRKGHVIPNPDVFPFPERFDTRACEKRRKPGKKRRRNAM